MKKLILVFITAILFSSPVFGQYIPETRVDSVVNLVSISSLTKFMRELTGDTITFVGGNPFLIFSRYGPSPVNPSAAQYIYEKFQSYGLNVRYQVGDSNTTNVIARKTGTRFPNQKIVIGAHYDNILWPENPQPLDTVHGADDNASGTSAVLEMARLLANMNFDYTIEFAAWDNEEVPPSFLYGSRTYADSAYFHGDSIRFYINMDMISYNYQNQNKFQAGSDSASVFYNDLFAAMTTLYVPQYSVVQIYASAYGSDHASFIKRKYRAFSTLSYSITPEYHKITDDFAHIQMPYLTDFVKPILGMLMVIAGNKNAFFEHKPLTSTTDTSSRNIWAVIKFPNQMPGNKFSPKLYYKINSSPFHMTNAYERNQDTFKYTIPGAPKGAVVKYYLAAQDAPDNFVCTYPIGGSGINPPGSTPPANPFTYYVYNNLSLCSKTLPKPIEDNKYTKDSIYFNGTETVTKLCVNLTLNHANDGDIVVQLFGPGGMVNLASQNGSGGQNFINTTFDDTASMSISQGTPPFTGTYRPVAPLSFYNNKQATGYWVLRIFDLKAGNTGELVSWCLQMQTKSSVGIEENTVPVKYELSQNYPNPFNPITNIKFSILNSGNVKIVVYDIQGREVKTLVNERLSTGTYERTFDASMLPSGIYFYRLEVNGFTETKKMLLIK